MKLHKSLITLASILLLTACGNIESVEDKSVAESEVEEESPKKEAGKKEHEEETMEINSEQPLENIGEYKYTTEGRVELIDINRPAETFKFIDGVDINYKDIKVLQYSEVPENQNENFREYYGFDMEGYSVQISYSVTNNTNQKIGGIEILDIVTSNGNQYNIYNNGGSLRGSAHEVRPNATANVGVVFYVEDSDINSLDLYLQPLDKDGYHLDETLNEIIF